MKTKYRIDWDDRVLVLKYIRKYDSYRKWLNNERERILNLSSKPIEGMPRSGRVSDMTAGSIIALENLNRSNKARVVSAIDDAKRGLCADIIDDSERDKLCKAIWKSCLNGKMYNFDAFAGAIACERRQFYYYKNLFLLRVKKNLDL